MINKIQLNLVRQPSSQVKSNFCPSNFGPLCSDLSRISASRICPENSACPEIYMCKFKRERERERERERNMIEMNSSFLSFILLLLRLNAHKLSFLCMIKWCLCGGGRMPLYSVLSSRMGLSLHWSRIDLRKG